MNGKITITDAAKKQLEALDENGLCLRVVLGRSGCCSVSFGFYPDNPRGKEVPYKVDGGYLLFNDMADSFIQNLTIDYGRQGLFKKFIARGI